MGLGGEDQGGVTKIAQTTTHTLAHANYTDDRGGSAAEAPTFTASSVRHFKCWRPLDEVSEGPVGGVADETAGPASNVSPALREWARQVPPWSLGW